MGCFLLVVVNIINVLGISIPTENDPPVGPHCDSPKAFQPAFEWVKPETRHIHMGNSGGRVKGRQNIPQLADMLRVHTARVILLKTTFFSPLWRIDRIIACRNPSCGAWQLYL